jgi:hypothetical protein
MLLNPSRVTSTIAFASAVIVAQPAASLTTGCEESPTTRTRTPAIANPPASCTQTWIVRPEAKTTEVQDNQPTINTRNTDRRQIRITSNPIVEPRTNGKSTYSHIRLDIVVLFRRMP